MGHARGAADTCGDGRPEVAADAAGVAAGVSGHRARQCAGAAARDLAAAEHGGAGRAAAVGDAPSAPVGVVFGAGLWNGEPSPYLAHRLDAAVALYRDGKVRALLVTGDNSRDDSRRAETRCVPIW